MKTETLLLIGRTGADAGVLETHAERLDRRNAVDAVETATYESEPVRELRDQFTDLEADRVYSVPMVAAHSHDTIDGIPRALSYVDSEVRYCEPPGQSPAITDGIVDRASEKRAGSEDVSLILVAFGSSSKPYHQQMVEYHATRLREESGYGEVLPCYVLQNPAVECVRYNVSNPKAVAVPLFVTRNETTAETIPSRLDVDRGGMAYTEPLAGHDRVTDAIHAELEKQRVLATETSTRPAFESQLTKAPVATDGEGLPR